MQLTHWSYPSRYAIVFLASEATSQADKQTTTGVNMSKHDLAKTETLRTRLAAISSNKKADKALVIQADTHDYLLRFRGINPVGMEHILDFCERAEATLNKETVTDLSKKAA